MFFFLMPLVGHVPGVNWEVVCELLSGSLRSVLRQTYPDFKVLIAGQDKPDIPEFADPRIEFVEARIPYPPDASLGNLDKFRKFQILVSHALERKASAIAFMDADDRISKNIVKFYRDNTHPFGYLYSDGYVWDYVEKFLAPSLKVLKAPFYMRCGTSLILNIDQLRYDFRNDLHLIENYINNLGKHTEYKKRAQAASRPFADLPFPAAVYVLNHGVGLHYRRGWKTKAKSKRHARIRKHCIMVTDDIRDEFFLDGDFKMPEKTVLSQLRRFLSQLDKR